MNKEFPLFDDKNVTYNGSSSSNLSIEQGELVFSVLDKLVVQLSLLIDKVNACSFCEGEPGQLSFSDSDINASGNFIQNSIVSSSPASVRTSPNATGVNVSFNLDSAIESLGDVTLLRTKTVINGLKNGFPSQILSTDKTNVSVNIRPDNFPASLESEIRYQDSSGEKVLKLRIPLSSIDASLNLPFQGGVSGSTNISTQKDINDNFQARILALESLVNSMASLNISGFSTTIPPNSSYQEALTQVLTEIDTIKSQLP